MPKKSFVRFLILMFIFLPKAGFACDACGCALSKMAGHSGNNDVQKWFFDFTFEQQNWKEKPAEDAHALIDEGHDFHDKTHEEFYHFAIGAKPIERFTLLAEIPYAVREALEVEDHDHLGEKQHSEGWGDLKLMGIYNVWAQGEDFVGLAGGVKFPTGQTHNNNFQGERFEVELQPGSGSYDYPLGIVYQSKRLPVALNGNVSYVIKREGSQEFQFGDLFFASFNAGYVLNPQSRDFQTTAGIDVHFHHEEKQTDHGVKIEDSGETSLFLGPALDIRANDAVSIFGYILFPVYQETGGVHQKLDALWTAGAKMVW